MTHSLPYPQTVEHYTDYLRMRLSEPCNRGALKTAHHALVFLNELTGTQVQDRPTSTQLYSVIYRELLTAALPSRASKQAPRMLVSMLSALENVVLCQQVLPFVRVYAWWILVQNWATLRFSDHRGIDPSSVAVTGVAFSAVLSRSKTIGADKSIGSRPLTIAPCCFLSQPHWMQTGFSLLQHLAPFPRDFLLPSPAANLEGAITREMRYETGYGLQNRVLLHLREGESQLHIPGTTQFWTPHSGRAFLPSATALLGFEKSDRDFLGGWAAQGSDRYARVSRTRVANMQKAVIRAIHESANVDPLGKKRQWHSSRRT